MMDEELVVEPLSNIVAQRNNLWAVKPQWLYPYWFGRCTVRVLLVTDGGLDFGSADFGLRAFIKSIQAAPFYVTYQITLAHRRFRAGDAMLDGDATIARRITNFRFDNAGHFAPDMYDEAWLFGIETGTGIDATELRSISDFMNVGGGVFATGDHGALGKAMGGEIPRVRSMRLWDHTSADPNLDEVGMQERRRNDTNRPGHVASREFDDQSDDVPQPISPRLYHVTTGFWKHYFPHPVLCGPRGMIKVMPDHPHEGECVEPTDLSQTLDFGGGQFDEYPPGTSGNPRPVPEVIATSSVPAGNVASSGFGFGKDATDAHSFGGIAAYDGHRASVGRVVTDATWHHFVNINLIGDPASPDASKQLGFLFSASGQAHLDDIKAYFSNLAVWLAPAPLIACMNRRIWWMTILKGRVIEAVSTKYTVTLGKSSIYHIWAVGNHARDALGRLTSVCQSRRLILDLIYPLIRPEIYKLIDPWWPEPPPDPRPPWFGLEPLLDAAAGASAIALRETFLEGDGKQEITDETFDRVSLGGAQMGLDAALENLSEAINGASDLWGGHSSREARKPSSAAD